MKKMKDKKSYIWLINNHFLVNYQVYWSIYLALKIDYWYALSSNLDDWIELEANPSPFSSS